MERLLVVAALAVGWSEKISKSDKLMSYAANRGAQFTPYWGDEAQARAMGMVQNAAWTLFLGGKAKISPDTVGIPKP